MKKVYFERSREGFALIEVLVSVFILATVAFAVAGSFVSAIKSVTYAKDVIAATALANEQMENLHNLPYDSLATVHGTVLPLPAKPLDDVQYAVDREGIKFDIYTYISYYDDPYDGLAINNADTAPIDYKKVAIYIRLSGKPSDSTALATLSTNIGAKAAETAGNTGILDICVKNAPFNFNDPGSQPVGAAQVTITNPGKSINIINAVTDVITGCLMVPNLPVDSGPNYHILVTKNGYSTDQTYSLTDYPGASNPNLSVLRQQVNSKIFVIDKLSTMDLQFVDVNGTPIANVGSFTLSGAKTIVPGSAMPLVTPILKYTQNFTPDAVTGKISIPNLEFDNYSFSNPVGYSIIAISPSNPVQLNPNITLPVIITLSSASGDPTITTVMPDIGHVGQTVTLDIMGTNFQNGAVAILYMITSGNSRIDITGTTTFISDTEINITMHLAAPPVGQWNLEITNPDGKKTVGFNIFEVKN